MGDPVLDMHLRRLVLEVMREAGYEPRTPAQRRRATAESEGGLVLQTTAEVADRIHISESFVRKHLDEFAWYQLGDRILIESRSVEAYVERHRRGRRG